MVRLIAALTRILYNISGALLVIFLMVLTVSDILGRYFFNRPITGTVELVSTAMVGVVFLALGYSYRKGDHISIDLVYNLMPRKFQRATDIFASLMVLCVALLMTRGLYQYMLRVSASGATTGVLRLPIYPFVGIATLGTVFFGAAAVERFIRDLWPKADPVGGGDRL